MIFRITLQRFATGKAVPKLIMGHCSGYGESGNREKLTEYWSGRFLPNRGVVVREAVGPIR